MKHKYPLIGAILILVATVITYIGLSNKVMGGYTLLRLDDPNQVSPYATSTPTTSTIPLAQSGTSTIKGGWIGASSTGDLIYYDGTDLQDLAIGTAGQVLQVNSGATAPEWVEKPQGIGASDSATYYNYTISMITDPFTLNTLTFTPKIGYVELESSGGNWFAQGLIQGVGADNPLQFDDTGKTTVLEFRAKAQNGTTGDRSFGFGTAAQFVQVYTDNVNNRVTFSMDGATLYATTHNGAVITNTDISAGITVTNWNLYRIEWTPGTDAKFYVNGTLLATHTTGLPTSAADNYLGFGGTTNGEDLVVSNIYVQQEL
jgi:hypothetical protein